MCGLLGYIYSWATSTFLKKYLAKLDAKKVVVVSEEVGLVPLRHVLVLVTTYKQQLPTKAAEEGKEKGGTPSRHISHRLDYRRLHP